jgi:hypothetical protein
MNWRDEIIGRWQGDQQQIALLGFTNLLGITNLEIDPLDPSFSYPYRFFPRAPAADS